MNDEDYFPQLLEPGYEVYKLPFAEFKGDPPRRGACRKFHVSAHPGSAAGVIAIVSPFLRERNIHHKAVMSPAQLRRLDDGESAGKFITIYQEPNRSPEEITDLLGGMLRRAAEVQGLKPGDAVPRHRPSGYVFAEQPYPQSGFFVFGGFDVDQRSK